MYSFPRSSRLCKADEFKRVWGRAKRYSMSCVAVFVCPNVLGRPRLGLSIGKKNVRRAVDRNRLKRIARETFRVSQSTLGSCDLVVVAYKGAAQIEPCKQYRHFQQLWLRVSAAQESPQ